MKYGSHSDTHPHVNNLSYEKNIEDTESIDKIEDSQETIEADNQVQQINDENDINVESVETKDNNETEEESLLNSLSEEEVDMIENIGEENIDQLINDLENVIVSMQEDYKNQNRGIEIIKVDDAYQLCTKKELYEYIYPILDKRSKPNLSNASLETLAIIAYNPKITRAEIEAIRGVSCVHAINKLVEYKLVAEVGRLDAIGRPILFGTTEDFLRSFGVTSMDELPIISPDKIEDFKKEAMEEINIKVET